MRYYSIYIEKTKDFYTYASDNDDIGVEIGRAHV